MRYRTVPAFRSRGASRLLLAGGTFLLVALLVALPVEIPSRIVVPGHVLPEREWSVVRSAGGAVSASLRDHRSGAVTATFAAEPARGDAVQLHLRPLAGRRTLLRGDTIGVVASGETARRLAALDGEIEAARAQLRLYQVGDKEALVEAARQDARRADASEAYAATVYERQRALADRGVVAREAAEGAENELRLAQAEAAAARARHAATRSGARHEQLALARAQIATLEGEGAALSARARLGTLVAPLSGRAYRVFSADTLLMVADTAAYVVALPVRWAERDRVAVGQEVALRTSAPGPPPRARIVDVRETPQRPSGQPYLMAMAEVVSGHEALAPGQLVRCVIEAEPEPPLAYLDRLVGSLLRW